MSPHVGHKLVGIGRHFRFEEGDLSGGSFIWEAKTLRAFIARHAIAFGTLESTDVLRIDSAIFAMTIERLAGGAHTGARLCIVVSRP